MSSPQFDREVSAKSVAMGSLGAVRVLAGFRLPPCPYSGHRGTDWRLASGGPLVCGVCHPPAPQLEVVR
jgi:hypothetical protein